MQPIEEYVRRDVDRIRSILMSKSIPVTESGCWLWLAGKSGGYGYFSVPGVGNNCAAHRVSFVAFKNEPLVKGMHIHHKCSTPTCVNPNHLIQVTPKENTNAIEALPSNKMAARINCKKGHPLSGSNLYLHRGHRMCRQCRYETTMKYYSTRTTVAARGRKPKCQ